MTAPVLHGYWRSSASYRVRIALNMKGVGYQQIGHDLRAGAQRDPAYLKLAPHGLVPAIEHDGQTIIESPAILEWIDACWPEPPLLPAAPLDAAIVRAMGALVACDIHPLNNLRVLKALRADFGATDQQVNAWVGRWITEGFTAIERMIEEHGGRLAFGDTPTLADCYLVPQVYNANRFSVDLAPFPRVRAVNDFALTLPAFAAAQPDRQPDASQ